MLKVTVHKISKSLNVLTVTLNIKFIIKIPIFDHFINFDRLHYLHNSHIRVIFFQLLLIRAANQALIDSSACLRVGCVTRVNRAQANLESASAGNNFIFSPTSKSKMRLQTNKAALGGIYLVHERTTAKMQQHPGCPPQSVCVCFSSRGVLVIQKFNRTPLTCSFCGGRTIMHAVCVCTPRSPCVQFYNVRRLHFYTSFTLL